MSLSKVSRYCLESNSFFIQDIMLSKKGVHYLNKQRERCGEFHILYEELRACPDKFFEYTRMSVETFDYILDKIESALTTTDTNFQKSLTAKEKLFLTLRFLSTGMSFKALTHSFRLGRSTVAKMIYHTCKAIWNSLQMVHLPKPSTDRLKEVADEYYEKWQFPNCIGAIDGKHFRVNKPKRSGSEYWNYKEYFSVILQAVADADYKFIAVEVDGRGKQSDGGTFQYSKLNELLCNDSYNVPPPTRLPGSDEIVPNVIIGDETYPLKTFLMRPYPGRGIDKEKTIFNKRLSRARNCVECAFGILANKWRLFLKPIETNLKHTRLIIKVACLLHNIVRERDGNRGLDIRAITEEAEERIRIRRRNRRNNRATTQAIIVRNKYKDYFNEFLLTYL